MKYVPLTCRKCQQVFVVLAILVILHLHVRTISKVMDRNTWSNSTTGWAEWALSPLLTRLDASDNQAVNLPTIYVITPTHSRLTQAADLTQLANTLSQVPSLHWVVVEDALNTSSLVSDLLARSSVSYTHLSCATNKSSNTHGHRGIEQRNTGIRWLRGLSRVSAPSRDNTSVVYFADDDNTYALQLFTEMRYTMTVSVWPVAFVGGLKYERPVCAGGHVVGWFRDYGMSRKFPMDMAGFAVNLDLMLRTGTEFDLNAPSGYIETKFLERLGIGQVDLQARADNCTKVNVWHTKTSKPHFKEMNKVKGGDNEPDIEV